MCSRAPEALNTCCAGPFPLPARIARTGLRPAEHPWSRGAQYPGAAAGAPSLRRPCSPACGRTPSEARGALRLSHGSGPEPHRAATGCGVGLVGPSCPTEAGRWTPRPSGRASRAALCLVVFRGTCRARGTAAPEGLVALAWVLSSPSPLAAWQLSPSPVLPQPGGCLPPLLRHPCLQKRF